MKITNKYGLPEALVRAVSNDPYSSGDSDISTTRLINPPYMERLRRQHHGEIVEDASDRIWALIGQSAHGILERSAKEGDIVEERFFASFYLESGREIVLSGQIDSYSPKTKTLVDFKVTSVWSVKDMLAHGVKKEYEAQLNVNRYLMAASAEHHKVDTLSIFAVCRDWRPIDALRYGDYPPRAALIPVPVWSLDQAKGYIITRLEDHFGTHEVPPCSPEERWAKETQWAVMKPGQKRAVKLHTSSADAYTHAATLNGGHYVEERPGEHVRCGSYCSVSSFCPDYQGHSGVDADFEPLF